MRSRPRRLPVLVTVAALVPALLAGCARYACTSDETLALETTTRITRAQHLARGLELGLNRESSDDPMETAAIAELRERAARLDADAVALAADLASAEALDDRDGLVDTRDRSVRLDDDRAALAHAWAVWHGPVLIEATMAPSPS